jgi:hypothetical protein
LLTEATAAAAAVAAAGRRERNAMHSCTLRPTEGGTNLATIELLEQEEAERGKKLREKGTVVWSVWSVGRLGTGQQTDNAISFCYSSV